MAHTLNAAVYDNTGTIIMMVFPDDDRELSDPAFNPPDCVQVTLSAESNDQDDGGVAFLTRVVAAYPSLHLAPAAPAATATETTA